MTKSIILCSNDEGMSPFVSRDSICRGAFAGELLCEDILSLLDSRAVRDSFCRYLAIDIKAAAISGESSADFAALNNSP